MGDDTCDFHVFPIPPLFRNGAPDTTHSFFGVFEIQVIDHIVSPSLLIVTIPTFVPVLTDGGSLGQLLSCHQEFKERLRVIRQGSVL